MSALPPKRMDGGRGIVVNGNRKFMGSCYREAKNKEEPNKMAQWQENLLTLEVKDA